MSEKNYLDYFEFQGKTYPLNTVVKAKDNIYISKNRIGTLSNYPMVQIVESFIDNNGNHHWTYAIWFRSGHIGHYITGKSPDEMIEDIIKVPSNMTASTDKRYYKDSEIPVVFVGWCIYIAFLIFTLIFKDFITAWVFGSFYFFSWRKNKLKKPELKYGFDVYEKVREWNERQT